MLSKKCEQCLRVETRLNINPKVISRVLITISIQHTTTPITTNSINNKPSSRKFFEQIISKCNTGGL